MKSINGILCVYKPQNMTSFDVVNKVKRTLHVKTGHSGTLDPMAEGVLVVAVNNATKALPYLGLEDKVYSATLKFGVKADTGDIWGETIETKPIPVFEREVIENVLKSMIGKQSQRVPMVSAKKINGKKLYEYHRNNEFVETQYTDIEIYSLELLDLTDTTISFKAHVSNGTYIRTLCEDIAESMDTVGTMSALCREKVGHFSLDQCISLEELELWESILIPTKEAIALPRYVCPEYETLMLHGKLIPLQAEEPIVFIDAGSVYAACVRTESGLYKIQRGLW